jgi:hypothetical protein
LPSASSVESVYTRRGDSSAFWPGSTNKSFQRDRTAWMVRPLSIRTGTRIVPAGGRPGARVGGGEKFVPAVEPSSSVKFNGRLFPSVKSGPNYPTIHEE